MRYEQRRTVQSRPRWRSLLFLVSPQWIALLLDLFIGLWSLLARDRGPYEFLLYDATLELRDSKGRNAVFRKHQRVKFLHDNVIAFEDFAWGDGKIFSRYRVSPGVEADRYREGDRWNVLISLRGTKQIGDVEDFHIERVVKDGFTQPEEWQQAEIRHHTRQLKLSVLFPKSRHCKRATIGSRKRNQTRVLGPKHFHPMPDGRQLLRWETSDVWPLEVFTLRWQW